MENQIVGGNWKQLKGKVRKLWGNLTDDDLERTQGDIEQISGIIQKKYGVKRDEIKSELESMVDSIASERPYNKYDSPSPKAGSKKDKQKNASSDTKHH